MRPDSNDEDHSGNGQQWSRRAIVTFNEWDFTQAQFQNAFANQHVPTTPHSFLEPGRSIDWILSEDRFIPLMRQSIVPSPHLIIVLYRRSSPWLNPLGLHAGTTTHASFLQHEFYGTGFVTRNHGNVRTV